MAENGSLFMDILLTLKPHIPTIHFHFGGGTLGLTDLDFSLLLQWLVFLFSFYLCLLWSECLHCLESLRLGSTIAGALDGEKKSCMTFFCVLM